MHYQSDHGIVMFARVAYERGNAHSENKHGEITQGNRHRMADRQVFKFLAPGHLFIFLFSGNRDMNRCLH